MRDALIYAPTDSSDENALADWLEATMLAERCAYMSRAKVRRYIKSILGSDEPDIAVEIVLREVARRRRIAGSGYPFVEEARGVKLVGSSAGTAYLFMLCISASRRYREQKRQKQTDELFDRLVLLALKRYMGPGSQGVRFASPASDGRPRNFRDAIHWLAHRMNVPKGAGSARPHAGDGGLDVAVWRPFRDERAAHIVLLAQCTVERDWFHKAKDLAEDSWRGWIDLGKDPHLVLAIPFVIAPSYEKWDDLRRLAHTVLDRLRLCDLLEGVDLDDERMLKRWVAAEVAHMSG